MKVRLGERVCETLAAREKRGRERERFLHEMMILIHNLTSEYPNEY